MNGKPITRGLSESAADWEQRKAAWYRKANNRGSESKVLDITRIWTCSQCGNKRCVTVARCPDCRGFATTRANDYRRRPASLRADGSVPLSIITDHVAVFVEERANVREALGLEPGQASRRRVLEAISELKTTADRTKCDRLEASRDQWKAINERFVRDIVAARAQFKAITADFPGLTGPLVDLFAEGNDDD